VEAVGEHALCRGSLTAKGQPKLPFTKTYFVAPPAFGAPAASAFFGGAKPA
jgi:hypothetical protein